MSLGNWIANQIIEEESKIKTVVAIYPGRFQPMGSASCKNISSGSLVKFDKIPMLQQAGKVDLPKSPFSFAEKKKIINSHGISNVVQVKKSIPSQKKS